MLFFDEAIKNRDLFLLLKSPIINAQKKHTIIKAIFENKIGKTTLAFFDIIIRKGREMFLPEISADFMDQYRVYNKISIIKLTTAVPLNEESLNEIKARLISSHVTLDKLEIIQKVNPKIIGGFMIEVGDKLYDASISHKLEQLKKEFTANQYVKAF